MLIQIQFNSLCVTDKIIGMHSEHASVSNIILHLRYQLTVVRMPWITLLETYLCASRIWNRSRNCVMRRILRWLRHQSSNPATLLTSRRFHCSTIHHLPLNLYAALLRRDTNDTANRRWRRVGRRRWLRFCVIEIFISVQNLFKLTPSQAVAYQAGVISGR